MHISVDTFTEAIKKSWHRESSGDPELRSDENPSYRQCLVTALLANEFLLLPVFAEKITSDRNRTGYHYFNKDKQQPDPSGGFVRIRSPTRQTILAHDRQRCVLDAR